MITISATGAFLFTLRQNRSTVQSDLVDGLLSGTAQSKIRKRIGQASWEGSCSAPRRSGRRFERTQR